MSTYQNLEKHNHSHLCFNIHVDISRRTHGHVVSDVTICILNLGLMFVAIAANALAILAYRRTSILQTPSNYLLMILSIVDIILASTVQPLFLIWKILELADSFSCILYFVTVLLINLLGAVSFLITSFLITVERYLSVFFPIFHRKNANKRVFKFAILLISSAWLVFLLAMFFSRRYVIYLVVTASLVTLCLAGTIACYRCIFVEMSRRCNDRIVPLGNTTDDKRRPSRKLRREKATAMNMIFIIGAMTLLYTPIGACVVYAAVIGRDWLYMNYLVPWSYVLVFTSNAIHPFLYGWKSRGMRKSIGGVIRRIFEETDV